MPLTFLLIDDDVDDRELFEMAVEDLEEKVNCITISAGPEALRLLESKEISPDFIFLDLNMPEMDGREILKALKRNEVTRKLPVIIISTSSEDRDIEETSELGAIAFITKPSRLGELTDSLAQFLNSNQSKTTSKV